MTRRHRHLFLIGLLLAAGLPAVRAKQPDFPPPPKASVKTVGSNVVVSGNAMYIRQFFSSEHMDRVNAFYYRKWARGEKGRKPGYVESDAMAPWHIISRVEDGYLMTVQIQPADNGGSWGYLAMSRVDTKKPGYDGSPDIPRMSHSKVLHHMESTDTGQQGQTLLLSNPHSLASNVNFYQRYYETRGWRVDLNQSIPVAKMHVLAFTNGRYKINIMLTGDGSGTQVVVNRISHDIL